MNVRLHEAQINGALGSRRRGDMLVTGRRGDRQNPADRLDPIDVPVIVEEGDHRLNERPSSACAK